MRILPLLILLAGCTEYDLEDQGNPNAGANAPAATVTPDSVLGATCGGDAQAQVTLGNEGTALLGLTGAEIVTGNWRLDPLDLPATIPVGESLVIEMSGLGTGKLELTTTDPERELIEVPLDAIEGRPPEVTITSPDDNDTIGLAQDILLQATVVDVDGDPSDLEVVWTSDIDGAIGSSQVDTNGATTLTWRSANRTPGGHEITATVDHPCGEGDASTTICQQGGFVEEEIDLASWHFEGSASWDGVNNWLQITNAYSNQVGSAFETDQVVRGDDVVVRFRMYMGDGTGADGMSVTVLDSDRMTTFLGGDGCGLGFGGGSCSTSSVGLPGYSIEFDTYYNSEADPTEEDHVAFYVDGDLTNPLAWAAVPELEDTGWHDVVVTIQEPAVEVTIDGNVVISAFMPGDVNFDFPAHVGFTAGTGYFHNLHLVDSLEVEQLVCP